MPEKKKNMKTDVTQDYLEVQLSRKNLSNQTLLLRIGQLEELLGHCRDDLLTGQWPFQEPIDWRYHIWRFPEAGDTGIPQNGWFIREKPSRINDLGVPLLQETST